MAVRMSRSDSTLKRFAPALLADALIPRFEQRVDLALEVLEVLEALIDAGKSDVGDLVDVPQLVHGQSPDSRGRDLARAGRPQLGLDLVGGGLGDSVADGATRQRLAQAGGKLVAIELLARAVALDDHQPGRLDPLVGREAGAAR